MIYVEGDAEFRDTSADLSGSPTSTNAVGLDSARLCVVNDRYWRISGSHLLNVHALGLPPVTSPVLCWVDKHVALSGLWGRRQRFPAGHRSFFSGVTTARAHYLVLT